MELYVIVSTDMSDKNDQNWNIIGHDNVVSYLQNIVANNKLVHAYLFHGAMSLGKTKTSLNFAKALLCANQTVKPCNKCQSCIQFEKKIHPDFFSLDLQEDKKNISIDQIREWQQNLYRKSLLGQYKVGIINNAEMLSIEAANAILKTIEEPKGDTIIITIANNLNSILPTIISRSQLIKFNLVETSKIRDYVGNVLTDRSKSDLISELSFGLPGKAIRYMEDSEAVSVYQNEIDELLKILSLSEWEKSNYIDTVLGVGTNLDDTTKVNAIIDNLLLIMRNLYLAKLGQNQLLNLLALFPLIDKLKQNYSMADIINTINKIYKIKLSWGFNPNPRLLAEDLILNQ